jgi:hypothetical protein
LAKRSRHIEKARLVYGIISRISKQKEHDMGSKKMMIAIALLAAVSASVFSQRADPESDFEAFPIDEDGEFLVITAYLGNKREVRIPSEIKGLPVTYIGVRAFAEKNLITVSIPDSVIRIHEDAFRNNQLISVSIGNNVTSILDCAFIDNQLTSVSIPSSTSVDVGAFDKGVTITRR